MLHAAYVQNACNYVCADPVRVPEPEKKRQSASQSSSQASQASQQASQKRASEEVFRIGQFCEPDGREGRAQRVALMNELLKHTSTYKVLACCERDSFPSPDFLKCWGLCSFLLDGFGGSTSPAASPTQKLHGILDVNPEAQNYSRVARSLVSMSSDAGLTGLTAQHALRLIFSVGDVWERLGTGEYLEMLAGLMGSMPSHLEDLVFVAMAAAFRAFLRDFQGRAFTDHLEVFRWLDEVAKEVIDLLGSEGLKACRALCLERAVGSFGGGVDGDNLDYLVRYAVKHVAFCMLRYADKFVRDALKRLPGERGAADPLCKVIRNSQYLRVYDTAYALMVNFGDHGSEEKDCYHLLYLRAVLIADSPLCVAKGYGSLYFFFARFYGDHQAVFGEPGGSGTYSMCDIFGDAMSEEGLQYEAQQNLLSWAHSYVIKKIPFAIEVVESENRYSAVFAPLADCPEAFRSKQVSKVGLNPVLLMACATDKKSFSSPGFTVNLYRLSGDASKQGYDIHACRMAESDEHLQDFNANDLMTAILRITDREYNPMARLSDRPCTNADARDFTLDLKGDFDFRAFAPLSPCTPSSGTELSFNEFAIQVCNQVYPAVVNSLCGGALGDAIARTGEFLLGKLVRGFCFGGSSLRLVFDKEKSELHFAVAFKKPDKPVTAETAAAEKAAETAAEKAAETAAKIVIDLDAPNQKPKGKSSIDSKKSIDHDALNLLMASKMASLKAALTASTLSALRAECLAEHYSDLVGGSPELQQLVEQGRQDEGKYNLACSRISEMLQEASEDTEDDLIHIRPCKADGALALAEGVSPLSYAEGWRKGEHFCTICNRQQSKPKQAGKLQIGFVTGQPDLASFRCNLCYDIKHQSFLITSGWAVSYRELLALEGQCPDPKQLSVYKVSKSNDQYPILHFDIELHRRSRTVDTLSAREIVTAYLCHLVKHEKRKDDIKALWGGILKTPRDDLGRLLVKSKGYARRVFSACNLGLH
jgi:hypothetical protein